MTINTYQHREVLGRVVDGRMVLNEHGCIVRDIWREVPLHLVHAVTDAWVVMPKHVLAIVRLLASDPKPALPSHETERFGRPVAGPVATIVRSFKAATTRTARTARGRRQERFALDPGRVSFAEGANRTGTNPPT